MLKVVWTKKNNYILKIQQNLRHERVFFITTQVVVHNKKNNKKILKKDFYRQYRYIFEEYVLPLYIEMTNRSIIPICNLDLKQMFKLCIYCIRNIYWYYVHNFSCYF